MSQLQSLLNQYNQQANRLNSLTLQKRTAADKERRYRKRKSELEAIRRNITSRLTSQSDDARQNQGRTCDKMSSGIQRETQAADIISQIEAGFESTLSSDPYGSSMINFVDAEIRDCDNQIESAQQEQRQTQNGINGTNSSMRALRNSINQEAQDNGQTVTWA